MVRRALVVVMVLAACQFESSNGVAETPFGESMGSTGETTSPTSSAVTTASETSMDSAVPTGPTDPTNPTNPTDPTDPTDPTTDSTTNPTGDSEADSGDSDPTTGETTAVSSSTSGDVTELQIAEELIVSLDATNGNASATGWINDGTMGDFEAIGSPIVETLDGLTVVTLSADSIYRSTANPPATLVEPDSTRTIEVWAYNPVADTDESMVAWGRRNGPNGSLMVFNYGTQPEWGAANHWGDSDLGWAEVPQQAMWHHLAYTFDGTTTRVYVDGVLDNEEVVGAGVIDTHDDERIVVGAQTNSNGDLSRFATLSVVRIRVHAGVLDANAVANNYELERDELGL